MRMDATTYHLLKAIGKQQTKNSEMTIDSDLKKDLLAQIRDAKLYLTACENSIKNDYVGASLSCITNALTCVEWAKDEIAHL